VVAISPVDVDCCNGWLSSKLLLLHRLTLTVWSYLLLGWLPIISLGYLDLVPGGALTGILAGGLCYSAATLFLIFDRRRWHFHAIWHLFVLAGSSCHFCAVFLFVAGAPLHVS
jgi:hemolysin III